MLFSTPFIGELLVLIMLLIMDMRIFFTKHTRIDSVVLLEVLAFFVDVFIILGFGATFSNVAILSLIIATMIINHRSFFRFCGHLLVDTYSPAFIVGSSFLLLFTVFFIVAEFYLCPVFLNTKKLNVALEKSYYTGNWTSGFSTPKNFYDKRTVEMFTYYSTDKAKQKNCAIVISGDIKSGARGYEPLCLLLAKDGYKVFCANFYEPYSPNKSAFRTNRFLRKFLLRFDFLRYEKNQAKSNNKNFSLLTKDECSDFYNNSCTALLTLAKTAVPPETKILLVTDGFADINQSDFYELLKKSSPMDANNNILTFSLLQIREYNTSPFGFVQQTEPIFSFLAFGLPREKSNFQPSYCAYKIKQFLNLNGDVL